MKDMGAAKQILGIRIMRDRNKKKLWLSQEHYVERVLQRFQMENAKALVDFSQIQVESIGML